MRKARAGQVQLNIREVDKLIREEGGVGSVRDSEIVERGRV